MRQPPKSTGGRPRATRDTARLIVALLAAAAAWPAPRAGAQALTAAQSSPANLTVKLEPVANLGGGLVPIDAAAIPGDPKLYVGTYVASSASVRVVDPVAKTISATPFLTFAGTGVAITGAGLQGIAFSPNFHDHAKPGYRKFYTYEAETSPGAASVMFRHPEVASPGTLGVLREWTANAAGTAIDTSIASRVVFNFGTPAGHMGGGLKFGPDGFLYLATGDGGGNGNGFSGSVTSASDGFTGRDATGTSTDVPAISNGQDFTNVLGKIIRIDPYVTNADGSPRATPPNSTAKTFSGATRYFIPDSNPFVGNPQNLYFTPLGPADAQPPVAPLTELFAIGFRNPWKLSFDKDGAPGALPYVADVGSRAREEIVLAAGGHNYGWPYREGDVQSSAADNRPLVAGNLPYLKQTSPGVFAPFDLDPTLSDPAQMSLPIVRLGTQASTGNPLTFADKPGSDANNDGLYGWQYGDGNAVTGGFVYRGAKIPALAGMYVFGAYQKLVLDPLRDPSTGPATSDGGRLYYFDPNEAGTYKTVRVFNFLAGFGIDNTRVGTQTGSLGDLMSIAQGDDGELYALFVNGDVKKIVGPPAGDFDGDFDVDAADLHDPAKGWIARFGVDLDASDFLDWQRNLGSTAAAQGVPEPAQQGAAASLALLAGARRRRTSPGAKSKALTPRRASAAPLARSAPRRCRGGAYCR
jgi:glucose/arabinose dehydrogenase